MISEIIKRAAKLASDNSPVILTSVGVAGVITTAVLTGKATFKAAEVLAKEEAALKADAAMGHPLHVLTNKEKAQIVWREYIPAAGVGAATITAVIMANRIGTRRTAAMAAAFTLTEKAFVEYKDKVVDTIGRTKEQRVRDDVAQQQVTRTPVPSNLVIVSGNEQLCFDSWSGRYFLSTMEELKKAMNDLNHRVLQDMYASLSDFYDLIGLEHTQESDDIGWNVDKLLDLEFSTCISPDQKPAISISYRVEPIRGFHRLS